MTYAVLYGVEMKAPKSLGEEGWYALCDRYSPWTPTRRTDPKAELRLDRPSGDSDFEGVGFWCAVGASGEDGVPDLAGFPLDDFAGASKVHRDALARAKAAWEKFAAWVVAPHHGGDGDRAWKMKGIKLPEPRLYLVQTEVA